MCIGVFVRRYVVLVEMYQKQFHATCLYTSACICNHNIRMLINRLTPSLVLTSMQLEMDAVSLYCYDLNAYYFCGLIFDSILPENFYYLMILSCLYDMGSIFHCNLFQR